MVGLDGEEGDQRRSRYGEKSSLSPFPFYAMKDGDSEESRWIEETIFWHI
jgi:hypothetical protein